MIEKRYSDGKLAKWYYSQENVISDGTNEYYLASKESIRNVDYSMLLGTNDLLDELNRLSDENEQLKNRVDELEDDNMKYTLSTDKLEEYTKRFMPTKCINEFRDCKTNRYYWLDNEDNFTGALELLNLLDCENEQLKQQIHYLKIVCRNELDDETLKQVMGSLGDVE